MHITILNFQRTKVESVIETLQLQSRLNHEDSIKEITLQDFFSDSLYDAVKELDFINANSAGGGGLMAINYPLQSEREKAFVLSFFDEALKDEGNLYYYPKPNHYTEIDDFALFSLKKNLTPENLKIESLYRKGEIRRDLRGKLHTLLRKDKAIDDKIINKKFFYESRKLFNLSYQWKELEVSQEQREYDLIDKVEEFYPAPDEINIATTNVCNLKCIMCKLHNPKSRKNHKTTFFQQKQLLPEKSVYKIIDYAAQHHVHNLGFTAAGEVLLDERIFNFVSYARKKGVPLVGLVSNGILLGEKGEQLLESGVNRLTVSIDGATAEIYKKIRGADLYKVEQGVRKCVDYARKLNQQGREIEIELACVLVFDEMQSVEHKELYLSKWADARDIITRITFNELATFDENGWDTRNNAVIDRNKRQICRLPFQKIMINPYGDVTVCCTMSSSAYYDSFLVGNVNEQMLEEVWTGLPIQTLRRENLRKTFSDFSICARCNEWAYNDFSEAIQKPIAQEKTIL